MHIKRFRFKKLFIALSLFFVLIPSYGRGWHLLDKSEKNSSFYQIMPSDQDSQYRKVWWWIIFRDKKIAKSDGTRWDNYKLLYEVDCKNHCARGLYGVYYNEAEFVNKFPFNKDWQPAVPDSQGDYLIQTVCKKSPNGLFKSFEVDIKRELSSLRGNEDQSAIEESLAKGKWFLASAYKTKADEDNLVSILFLIKPAFVLINNIVRY